MNCQKELLSCIIAKTQIERDTWGVSHLSMPQNVKWSLYEIKVRFEGINRTLDHCLIFRKFKWNTYRTPHKPSFYFFLLTKFSKIVSIKCGALGAEKTCRNATFSPKRGLIFKNFAALDSENWVINRFQSPVPPSTPDQDLLHQCFNGLISI